MDNQSGLDLNFVDSIKDQKKDWDEGKRKRASEILDESIKIQRAFLATVRWQIRDFERQIENERQGQFYCVVNKEELLAFCEVFMEFYRNYVRLMFLRIDVTTAYKHLCLSESDWEYRFFARRLYTLMYETYGSEHAYLKDVNSLLKVVRKYVDEGVFDDATKDRKVLIGFLEKNKDAILFVRKKNEAHKSFDIDELFDAVENLSVKDSMVIIDEYRRLLDAFFESVTMLHKSLEEYNGRARTVQLGGPLFMSGLFD